MNLNLSGLTTYTTPRDITTDRDWTLEVWWRDDLNNLNHKATKIPYWLEEVGAQLREWEPHKPSEKITCFPPRARPARPAKASTRG